MRASCSSVLLSSTGERTRITSDSANDDDVGAVVDPMNFSARTPILVRATADEEIYRSPYGHQLPKGWKPVEADEYLPLVSSLRPGTVAYTFVDVFRPSPNCDGPLASGIEDGIGNYENHVCQSNVELTIRYEKDRSLPTLDGSGPEASEESKSDVVSLTQIETVTWSEPVFATFSPGTKFTHPSGNRHPSNSTQISSEPDEEMVLIDGERVMTKCILEAASSADGLSVEVEEVRFNDVSDENSPCSFTLRSGKDGSNLLYTTEEHDPCRKLTSGTKFSISWTTEVNVSSHYLKGGVSARLGTISVSWSPSPIPVPEEAFIDGEPLDAHGPLRLEDTCILHLRGPACYVENAPFDTSVDKLPDRIEVASPFEIVFHIKNKTALDQRLQVSLDEGDKEKGLPMMVAGLAKGDVCLGPFEARTLSYTAVATKPGIFCAPSVSISSHRYSTWLIHDSRANAQNVFVAPR